MAYELNNKIKDLVPYDPIAGEYRIRLDANESYLNPSPETFEQLKQAVSAVAFNRYPDPIAGAVCKAFAQYYGIKAENVAAGNGSDELISVILSAFLQKGDTVITLSPDFSMYRFYASIAEAELYDMKKREDLTIDVDALVDEANRRNARVIIFSNPCNPTSLGLAREEVRKLVRSVNGLVVLDEAYMDFWDQSLIQEVEQYDNLLILKTCSKAFGMAAIRLGFAVGCKKLVQAICAVKSPYNVNSMTQAAGAVLLSHREELEAAAQKLVESRKELFSKIESLAQKFPKQVMPYHSCTNFVFCRVPAAQQAYRYLLEQGIVVRLIGPEYLRITAGNPEENEQVATALESYFRKELER